MLTAEPFPASHQVLRPPVHYPGAGTDANHPSCQRVRQRRVLLHRHQRHWRASQELRSSAAKDEYVCFLFGLLHLKSAALRQKSNHIRSVSPSEPQIKRHPTNVTLLVESKAVLPCVTLGNPKPDVTWLKDDELIKVCTFLLQHIQQ